MRGVFFEKKVKGVTIAPYARVAQLVEQRIRNAQVGSSILPSGSMEGDMIQKTKNGYLQKLCLL